MRKLFFASVISLSFAACHSDGDRQLDIGRAVARITSVPPQVTCVSLTVAGPDHTIIDNFDVTPGQPALLTLNNLPVGEDLFSAAAYDVPCNFITGAQPSWLSTAVVPAFISAGTVTNVSLDLEPAGGANVGINFGGGDGGVGDGGVIDMSPGPDDGGPAVDDGGVNDLSPGPNDGGPNDLSSGIPDFALRRR
jgi:hypothetical protein